jgi:predicted dehydrogenase
MKVEALLAADDIEIILNLTLPAGHAKVSPAAIAAGKHVYSEKPLATSLRDAVALVKEVDNLTMRQKYNKEHLSRRFVHRT